MAKIGQSLDLFEEPFDWREEWKDMPEYEHEDMTPKITISVHFRNEEDLWRFAQLIEQDIIPPRKDCAYTKSIWFPVLEQLICADKRFVDENQVDLFGAKDES